MILTSNARVLLLGTDSGGTYTGVTTGTSQPIHVSTQQSLSIYLASIGTTSGGTILFEEADWAGQDVPYTGTWSVIATISASSFTGGAQVAYHVSPNSYANVRVRISSAITGGGSIWASLRMW